MDGVERAAQRWRLRAERLIVADADCAAVDVEIAGVSIDAPRVSVPVPVFVRLPLPLITPVRVSSSRSGYVHRAAAGGAARPAQDHQPATSEGAGRLKTPVGLIVRAPLASPNVAGLLMLKVPALMMVPPV